MTSSDDRSQDDDDNDEDEAHNAEPNNGNDPSDQTEAGRGDSYSIRVPGLDAYLRSVVNPLIRQLGGLDRIAQIVAKATSTLDIKMNLPEIRLPPDLNSVFNIDIGSAYESVQTALTSMVDWSRIAQSLIEPGLSERIHSLIADRMPPNWSGTTDWLDAARFVKETGWAIVWVPRSEVVTALLEAQPDQRESVLLAHADMIVEDSLACLSEISHPDFKYIADCIGEIGQCISAGHHRSAQALAGSVLTELLQGILGHKQLAAARLEYTDGWEHKSINVLRFALITSTIPLALSQFDPQKGDPVPAHFNRHAGAHRASPIQFTRLNALVGLLLVTALTRELQELSDDGLLRDEN